MQTKLVYGYAMDSYIVTWNSIDTVNTEKMQPCK
jgi:hypothetical protein